MGGDHALGWMLLGGVEKTSHRMGGVYFLQITPTTLHAWAMSRGIA